VDPRIRFLQAELASQRADLRDALDSVARSLRAVAPGEGRWSVDLVVEHLARTERGVVRLLSGLIPEASPRASDPPFDPSGFALHVALPWAIDRSRRVRGSQPAGEMDAETAWAALQRSREELTMIIQAGGGLRLEDVHHSHPAGGELDVYEWIAFVVRHEARHAAQIREIAHELEAAGHTISGSSTE
jgi:hypothetical protein